MKKTLFCIALISSAFIVADDILTKTGTNEAAIKKSILNAAMFGADEGRLPEYNAAGADIATAYKVTRAILLNQRGGIVTEMGNYFKKYYNSPGFKKDFNDAVEAYKPGDAPKDSVTLKMEYEVDVKTMAKAYDSAKKAINDQDKIKGQVNSSINQAQAGLEQVKKMIREHPEMLANSGMTEEEFLKKTQEAQTQMAEGKQKANEDLDREITKEKIAEDLKQAEKNYNEQSAQLKIEYAEHLANLPETRKTFNEKAALYQKRKNYALNIKSCLQHYLDATSNIDFDAALTKKGDRSYFTNNDYERKNNLWKASFRAGKEASNAARTFAQQWINEVK